MFNLIFKSSTSLTFEMDNKDIVVTNPFNVYVNETLVLNDFKNNVIYCLNWKFYQFSPKGLNCNNFINLIELFSKVRGSACIFTDDHYI